MQRTNLSRDSMMIRFYLHPLPNRDSLSIDTDAQMHDFSICLLFLFSFLFQCNVPYILCAYVRCILLFIIQTLFIPVHGF